MTSLFSSFDLYFFKGTLFAFTLICLMLSSSIFCGSAALNQWTISRFSMMEVLYSFIPHRSSQSSLLIIMSVFFSFIYLNLFSVNSFSFPLGSQASMVMFLGLSMWLSFVIFSSVKNYLGSLAHLIPEGAPIYMAVLLMVIELVSLLIRPLTLSVRMMANILAGHLLMILLSSLVFSFSPSYIFYVGLNLVELFVACIQSYIFTVMITLYYSDSN